MAKDSITSLKTAAAALRQAFLEHGNPPTKPGPDLHPDAVQEEQARERLAADQERDELAVIHRYIRIRPVSAIVTLGAEIAARLERETSGGVA